jgi:hypothetical protein
MEAMILAQSCTLIRALGVLVKRRVSARRGGDYMVSLGRKKKVAQSKQLRDPICMRANA